ncbi:MAG: hypothetical protein M0R22_11315, partial [Dehalococcoidia bacterium]|nr:hypothetical protein [Dehalococcoidia bacterium]
MLYRNLALKFGVEADGTAWILESILSDAYGGFDQTALLESVVPIVMPDHTLFVPLRDMLMQCVRPAESPARLCIPIGALRALGSRPPVLREIPRAELTRGKPHGAVCLERADIEFIAAMAPTSRVEVVTAKRSYVVDVVELLWSGTVTPAGDPIWPGAVTYTDVHLIGADMLSELITGARIEWSRFVEPIALKRRRNDPIVVATAAQRYDGLPAPLALPAGPRAVTVAGIEAAVRRKLYELASVMRPSLAETMPPTESAGPEAEQAAWQLLHSVVLSGAADLRVGVRAAEHRWMVATLPPTNSPADVADLAARCTAFAAVVADAGPPLSESDVQRVATGGLPLPGPPGGRWYYRVPFELALSAVASRTAAVRDGYAYVRVEYMTEIAAYIAGEMARKAEHAGLGCGIAESSESYAHDALALRAGLEIVTGQRTTRLPADAAAALKRAPACVHAAFYQCTRTGSLPFDWRVEAMRFMADCGYGQQEAADLLFAALRSGGAASVTTTLSDLSSLSGYAKFPGAKSSRCAKLRRPWRNGAGSTLACACPYEALRGSDMNTKRGEFASWFARTVEL